MELCTYGVRKHMENLYISLNFDIILSSVQFSHSVVSDSLRPHESQQAGLPCPSPTPGVHSDSRNPKTIELQNLKNIKVDSGH